MWQILLLFLLASSVCGAAQRKVDQRKVLYEDSDISKESDDDYYNDSDNDNNDNSENDSLSIDIDIDYARQRLIPSHSSYRSASASSSTTPPHAHLRRVPRHPWVSHRSGSDNRLDTYAAYHEEGYQSDQAPGSMTAQKLQEVGSPEAVQLSRRRYQEQQKIRTDELKRLASLHLESMQNEPLCKRPQARVIRMISETSIVYSPHATVLHRCDENSSCCQNNMVWAVKNQTTVEKVFWMRSINSRHSTATIVPMTNHTECHCINRPAQRRKRSSQCECPKHFINFAMPRGGTTSSTTTTSRCRCDCHLSNMTCQRMKNGDEGFAVSELKCIRSNDCSPPICSNGIFNLNTGRCPRSTQSQPRQLGFG